MIYALFRIILRIIMAIDLLLATVFLYLLTFLPQSWLDHFYHRLFRMWCRVFVRAVGVDLKLLQKNTKPFPKNYILIANHPSAFEDVGIPALFNIHTLGKIEVKSWWLVGRISTASGTIYVDRKSKESRKAALEEMKAQLLTGKNIALYPEGGCQGRRIFETFRYGAFELSIETGLPIVPVFLHYEAQQDFEWMDQNLITKLYQFMITKNNRANYYVFDAVDPKDFKTKEQYAEAVYKHYLAWQKKYLE